MGTLFLNESPLSLENPSDSLILAADEISELYYMPRPDESGINYDLLSFKVFDQGDLSSSPESISFNVSPVADLIDVVAIDNVVNRSEKAAGVTLSGTAEGAEGERLERPPREDKRGWQGSRGSCGAGCKRDDGGGLAALL